MRHDVLDLDPSSTAGQVLAACGERGLGWVTTAASYVGLIVDLDLIERRPGMWVLAAGPGRYSFHDEAQAGEHTDNPAILETLRGDPPEGSVWVLVDVPRTGGGFASVVVPSIRPGVA